jgi:hypothetical protein
MKLTALLMVLGLALLVLFVGWPVGHQPMFYRWQPSMPDVLAWGGSALVIIASARLVMALRGRLAGE